MSTALLTWILEQRGEAESNQSASRHGSSSPSRSRSQRVRSQPRGGEPEVEIRAPYGKATCPQGTKMLQRCHWHHGDTAWGDDLAPGLFTRTFLDSFFLPCI